MKKLILISLLLLGCGKAKYYYNEPVLIPSAGISGNVVRNDSFGQYTVRYTDKMGVVHYMVVWDSEIQRIK
jgi:hypothetical protein